MRAAAMAAHTPAGPPPAMRMSVSYWVGIPLLLRVVPVQAEARPGRVPAAASIPAADRKSRLFISLAWLKLYSFQYIRCEYRKNLQKYKHRFSPAQSPPRSAPSSSPENVCQDVSLSASSGPPRPSRAACRAALPCALLAVRAACRAAGAVSLRSTPPFTPFAFAHVRSGPPSYDAEGGTGSLLPLSATRYTIPSLAHRGPELHRRPPPALSAQCQSLRRHPLAGGGMSPCAAPPRSIPPPPPSLAGRCRTAAVESCAVKCNYLIMSK